MGLESHAHDATSVTNILGARMTCTRLLRTLPVPSPPDVSWIFSTPRRSFSSICARLLEVEAPRRPQSQEQVTELLCTQANGMPMLYRVCATSRLTRRARQQKTCEVEPWHSKYMAIVSRAREQKTWWVIIR